MLRLRLPHPHVAAEGLLQPLGGGARGAAAIPAVAADAVIADRPVQPPSHGGAAAVPLAADGRRPARQRRAQRHPGVDRQHPGRAPRRHHRRRRPAAAGGDDPLPPRQDRAAGPHAPGTARLRVLQRAAPGSAAPGAPGRRAHAGAAHLAAERAPAADAGGGAGARAGPAAAGSEAGSGTAQRQRRLASRYAPRSSIAAAGRSRRLGRTSLNKNLRPRLGMAVTPLLAVWPGLAMAQAEFHPYAASQYEFDSNVFSLPNRDQAILLTGDAARDDTDWRSVAGLDAAYAWDRGRDRLGVTAEGRRLLYDRFSQLDHNEYLASGQFDWKAGTAWDGTLGARQERRMASFATRTGTTERDMELDHNANAGVNVNLDPEWRVETAATWHKLDSPLPGFPDFQLRESGGTAALKYLGVSHLTAGVEAGYTDGRFS